jgi:hypothetical protein
MSDSTAKYFILIPILLIVLYFIWDSFNVKNNIDQNKNQYNISQNIINQDNITKCIKTIPNNNLSTVNIDDVKNILYSEDVVNNILHTEENLYSETTNKLIESSYNNLLTDVYKIINMDISLTHMGSNKPIRIILKLLKDSILTSNFIGLIRNYIGSSVFAYNLSNRIMFMGDCYNNNGTANYNANHSLTEIKHNKVSFIPAYTLCMIGEIQNNNVYVGSQFIMTFQDINNNTNLIVNEKDKKNDFFQKAIKKSNSSLLMDNFYLIPMCTFHIENTNEKLIDTFFNNGVNVSKPRILMINEEHNDNFNNDDFNCLM